MGQGLHTKMVAIASEVLGCDVSRVRINETCTDKVANTSPTAASLSSDLNGMAVRLACEKIRRKLDQLPSKKGTTWDNLILQAYFERIDLSAHGFYAIPKPLGSDFKSGRADFRYFTQGVGVSEVELDTLTGDWQLLRVDILMVRIFTFIKGPHQNHFVTFNGRFKLKLSEIVDRNETRL